MKRYALLVLVAGFLVAADDPKDELKKLEGTWIVRFHQRDGTWIPAEELKDETLLIAGNRMTFRLNGRATLEIVYEIDPARKPRCSHNGTLDRSPGDSR